MMFGEKLILLQKCQKNNQILSLSDLNNKLVQDSVNYYIRNLVKDGHIKSSINTASRSPNQYQPSPITINTGNNMKYATPVTPAIQQIKSFDIQDDVKSLMNQSVGEVMYQNI